MLFTVDAYIVKATADKFKCLGIATHLTATLIPMCHGQLLVVVLARINLRRRKLVAHTLDGILVRHHGMLGTVIVLPVFDMVAVSSLVVKPRLAVPDILTAGTDGRAIAPEIFYTLEKLDRRKLRHIVHKPTPHNSAPCTVGENLKPVSGHNPEMLEKIYDIHYSITVSVPVYCFLLEKGRAVLPASVVMFAATSLLAVR